jgi:hypothetical protein
MSTEMPVAIKMVMTILEEAKECVLRFRLDQVHAVNALLDATEYHCQDARLYQVKVKLISKLEALL